MTQPDADDARRTALTGGLLGHDLSEREIARLFQSGIDPAQNQDVETKTHYPYSDIGNGEWFAAHYGGRFRYAIAEAQWYQLDMRTMRWEPDVVTDVLGAARDAVRQRQREANEIDDIDVRKKAINKAYGAESRGRYDALIKLARGFEPMASDITTWDTDPWVLSAGNGVVDLHDGTLRPGRADDLISRGTNVHFWPDAECPRWLRFLSEIFDGDEELVSWVQRLVGYALTGITTEQVIAVLHGSGANGKDTFLRPLQSILGSYCATAEMTTFTLTREAAVRNDLARLHRSRLVIASESAEGRALDESTLKMITGGGKVTARLLYQQLFEYTPSYLVMMCTNFLPAVRGGDDAIWRRMRLVPFDVSFLGREDQGLAAELELELPGILAWAVRGCLEWQRVGLGTCDAVEHATGEYRIDEDTLGSFLAERCQRVGEVAPAILRVEYESFCKQRGEKPLGASSLGKRLRRIGIVRRGRDGPYEPLSLK